MTSESAASNIHLVTVSCLLLIFTFTSPSVSAETQEGTIEGVTLIGNEPIVNAQVSLTTVDSNEVFTTLTDHEGQFFFDFNPEEIEVGEQVMVQVRFNDSNGNERVITSCQVRNSGLRMFFMITVAQNEYEIGTSRWQHSDEYGDSYSITYHHLQSGGQSSQQFRTIDASGQEEVQLFISYTWDDRMDIDCDMRIRVVVQIHFGATFSDVVTADLDLPDVLTIDYWRVDRCDDPDDGGPFTSDPRLSMTVKRQNNAATTVLIPDGGIELDVQGELWNGLQWVSDWDDSWEEYDPSRSCGVGDLCEDQIIIEWIRPNEEEALPSHLHS